MRQRAEKIVLLTSQFSAPVTDEDFAAALVNYQVIKLQPSSNAFLSPRHGCIQPDIPVRDCNLKDISQSCKKGARSARPSQLVKSLAIESGIDLPRVNDDR